MGLAIRLQGLLLLAGSALLAWILSEQWFSVILTGGSGQAEGVLFLSGWGLLTSGPAGWDPWTFKLSLVLVVATGGGLAGTGLIRTLFRWRHPIFDVSVAVVSIAALAAMCLSVPAIAELNQSRWAGGFPPELLSGPGAGIPNLVDLALLKAGGFSFDSSLRAGFFLTLALQEPFWQIRTVLALVIVPLALSFSILGAQTGFRSLRVQSVTVSFIMVTWWSLLPASLNLTAVGNATGLNDVFVWSWWATLSPVPILDRLALAAITVGGIAGLFLTSRKLIRVRGGRVRPGRWLLLAIGVLWLGIIGDLLAYSGLCGAGLTRCAVGRLTGEGVLGLVSLTAAALTALVVSLIIWPDRTVEGQQTAQRGQAVNVASEDSE